MSESGEKRNGVTFKTMFEISMSLLGALAMILWLSTSGRIGKVEAKTEKLSEEKVGQTEFNRRMDKVEEKLDGVSKVLTDHEIRSARRNKRLTGED